MSISLYWEIPNPRSYVSSNSPSKLRSVIEKAFGQMPVMLDRESIGVLEAIKETGFEDEAVQGLIDAIEQHDSIKLMWEYRSPIPVKTRNIGHNRDSKPFKK